MTTVTIKATDIETGKVLTQQARGTVNEVMDIFNKMFKARRNGNVLKGFIQGRMVKVEFI
jgi:cell envelope opacity-associated protein A